MPTASPGPSGNRRLGDFEVVREIGRGGMGVVYEAWQVSLNRKVALKVLAAGLGMTSKAVERFHREAAAAARLHHTNIVPVYATGEHDGTHFYAMELIDGPSLDHVLRQAKQTSGEARPQEAVTSSPPELIETAPHVRGSSATASAPELSSSSLGSGSSYFDTVARMVADVADALEHAHQSGVIHRDIKPSNLLLSRDGRLSINDFGLARMLERPGMTMTGEFVGTPAYMSPEQITAGRTPLDHRTDIYSLGATLYEMLTLQPPFPGDRRDQVLAQILHKEPKPPRRVNKKVPVDLETICLKAMEKDPDRRYATAGHLANDLRHYVNRFAITARRAGPAERLKKWGRRHPGLVGGMALALLATGAAMVFAYRAHRVEQQRLADQNRLEQQLQHEQRQAAVERVIAEAMSGDIEAALTSIADAEKKGTDAGRLDMLRGWVELKRGGLKDALHYLARAETQLPTSVGVKALLSSAYMADGQLDNYIRLCQLLHNTKPHADEDYLFLSLALVQLDAGKAVRILEQAPTRVKESTLGRQIRFANQGMLACETGYSEDRERAFQLSKVLDLSDHPSLLDIRVGLYLNSAADYEREDPRQSAALEAAAQDFAHFARKPDDPWAVIGKCRYYFMRGDYDALLAEARRAREKAIEVPFLPDLEASVLYGRRQFDAALTLLPADLNYLADGSRGIILAAMPGRKKDAESAISKAISGCQLGIDLSGVTGLYGILGTEYLARSQEAARGIRSTLAHRIPNARNRWYHQLLEFNSGLIEADELLRRAGDIRLNLCEAYHSIGLRKLAEGDRAGAKAAFQKSADTNEAAWSVCYWSRAFLALIDDPDWLPWIPMEP